MEIKCYVGQIYIQIDTNKLVQVVYLSKMQDPYEYYITKLLNMITYRRFGEKEAYTENDIMFNSNFRTFKEGDPIVCNKEIKGFTKSKRYQVKKGLFLKGEKETINSVYLTISGDNEEVEFSLKDFFRNFRDLTAEETMRDFALYLKNKRQ